MESLLEYIQLSYRLPRAATAVKGQYLQEMDMASQVRSACLQWGLVMSFLERVEEWAALRSFENEERPLRWLLPSKIIDDCLYTGDLDSICSIVEMRTFLVDTADRMKAVEEELRRRKWQVSRKTVAAFAYTCWTDLSRILRGYGGNDSSRYVPS